MMDEPLPKIKPEEIKIEIINGRQEVKCFKSYEKELIDFLVEDALANPH